MSRAYRRFEERKRKLRRINEVYRDWSHTYWDGTRIYRDWSNHWLFLYGQKDKSEPIKYWKNMRMGESGHSDWVHTFMTKPHRTAANRLVRSIAVGRIKPDEAMFPIHGKPWVYFW